MRISILEVLSPVIEGVAIDVVNVFFWFGLGDDSVHAAVDRFTVLLVFSNGIAEGFGSDGFPVILVDDNVEFGVNQGEAGWIKANEFGIGKVVRFISSFYLHF